MAYMTYNTKQFSNYKVERSIKFQGRARCTEGLHRSAQPPRKMPQVIPKSENFIPDRLVRVSDMQVVQGKDVNEGYCTLSYSLKQSGDITVEENEAGECIPKRKDLGKHRIIYPAKTIRTKPRGRKRLPPKIRNVTFEGLIQKICQDFNIKYIWYDQLCINQDSLEEKYNAIRQMHQIYSNAYCTVALVPELGTFTASIFAEWYLPIHHAGSDTLLESQWMKRMWTLAETTMTPRILFVGQTCHTWGYRTRYISITAKDSSNDNVATTLFHAHKRTSTGELDRLFALANMFPQQVMNHINIDYNQPVLELMVQIYGLLAKKDPTILCFKKRGYVYNYALEELSNKDSNSAVKDVSPIQGYHLPSWTGVGGEHIEEEWVTTFQNDNYSINGSIMKVTCSGISCSGNLTIDATKKPFVLCDEDIPPLPQQAYDENNDLVFWELVIQVRLPGDASNHSRVVYISDTSYSSSIKNNINANMFISTLERLSHFMSIKKENLRWVRAPTTRKSLSEENRPRFIFSDTIENEEFRYDAHYVILCGIPFTQKKKYWFKPSSYRNYYPVLKKENDNSYYKTIGLCYTKNVQDFFVDYHPNEQIFEIQ